VTDDIGTKVEQPRTHLYREIVRSYNGNLRPFLGSCNSEISSCKKISDKAVLLNYGEIIGYSAHFLRINSNDPVTINSAIENAYLTIQTCEMDKWVYLFNEQKRKNYPRVKGQIKYVQRNSKKNRAGLNKYPYDWIFFHALAIYRDELIREIQKENRKDFDVCCDIFATTNGPKLYDNILNFPQKERIGEVLFRKAKSASELDKYFVYHPDSHISEETFETEDMTRNLELMVK
jgi:hypothetical protein